MSIWVHAHGILDLGTIQRLATVQRCPYCRSFLSLLKDARTDERSRDGGSLTGEDFKVAACPVCGWWRVRKTKGWSTSWEFRTKTHAAVAALRNLDLMDLSVPLEEIRSFLAANYDVRFAINPRRFEETVASVLVPEGFTSRVTAYTKDGGLDAIFDGPTGEVIGVEVKRHKGTIGVALIRAFTGALVVHGITRGVFVTTSRFSRDARLAADAANERGYGIELLDAPRFLEALELTQRQFYKDTGEFLHSIGEPDLQLVGEFQIDIPSDP